MSVMMLAASKGCDISIMVDGEDETSAMNAIIHLINNRFDEEE